MGATIAGLEAWRHATVLLLSHAAGRFRLVNVGVPTGLLVPAGEGMPKLTRRVQGTIVRAIALAWLAIFALNVLLSQLDGWDPKLALRLTISTLFGFAVSLALQRFMAHRARIGREASLLGIVVASLIGGLTLWTVDAVVQLWPVDGSGLAGVPWPRLMELRLNLVYFAMLFVLQGAGCRMLGAEIVLEARERQLLEARLSALRFQLNPHFVFNTLNAIFTLVAEAGARQAEEMIARLSDFMRSSLAGEPTDLVPLAEEMDLVQAYLEIEAVRFGERLVVRYAIDPGLAEARVPSLILQPLIENAVKYGVAPSKRPVAVTIEATSDAGDLLLVVEDDGRERSGQEAGSGTGVGLANIAARLDALYGRRGRIEAVRREVGFTAVLRLPLSTARDG